MKYRIYAIALFITFSHCVFGQFLNTVKFEKEEINLYSGVVGMHEDYQGYKWIFGFDGISRYNGFQFEEIASIYPSTKNLISKNCKSLFRDETNLWIGSAINGLFLVDNKGNLKSFNDLLSSEDSLTSNTIKQVISAENIIFVVGENGLECFSFDARRWVKKELGFTESSTITKIQKHENKLWAISVNGLQNLDLRTNKHNEFPEYKAASFFLEPNGKLWMANIGNGTILSYYDQNFDHFVKSEFQPYQKYKQVRRWAWLSENQLLSFPSNTAMLEISNFQAQKIAYVDESLSGLIQERFLRDPFLDSNNRVWLFGSELFMIPRETIISTEYVSKNEGEVIDVFKTETEVYSSISNKGLYIFNKRTKKTQILNTQNSQLADNFISNITPLKNGGLGLCMMNNFQTYSEESGFGKAYPMPGITRSFLENDIYYWVGGYRSVFKINKKTRSVKKIYVPSEYAKEGNAINAILDLGNDNLGICTAALDIIHLGSEEETIDPSGALFALVKPKFPKYKIHHADVSPSKKWIATATDNGIYIQKNPDVGDVTNPLNRMAYNMAQMRNHDLELTKIPSKERFFTNVAFYNDSILYASSRNHILRISINNFRVETYNNLDGLINSNFNLRSSFKDDKGLIYFGGDNGVDRIDEGLRKVNPKSIQPIVGQIFHNGIPQFEDLGTDKHIVPSNIKILEIKVDFPHNINGDLISLEGRINHDEDWFKLGEKNMLTLYNPKPGRNNFEFRAVTPNGDAISEISSMNVTIKRVWYANPWILGLFAIALITAVGIGISRYQKNQNKRLNQELRLQEELATLKLTSLNSQMNPHFIFNALSSIQHLIAEGETETAENYLSKFSKLLRHVIQYASHRNVSVTEEINFIKNYLELELLRFSDAFTYTIQNEITHPDKVYVPPFFIQPQVENAIKHGLLNAENKSRINIIVSLEGNKIKISVEDNGVGREAAKRKNIYAQTNTKKGNFLTEERIENLNKLSHNSRFYIEDLYKDGEPKGTRVTLEFELEKNT